MRRSAVALKNGLSQGLHGQCLGGRKDIKAFSQSWQKNTGKWVDPVVLTKKECRKCESSVLPSTAVMGERLAVHKETLTLQGWSQFLASTQNEYLRSATECFPGKVTTLQAISIKASLTQGIPPQLSAYHYLSVRVGNLSEALLFACSSVLHITTGTPRPDVNFSNNIINGGNELMEHQAWFPPKDHLYRVSMAVHTKLCHCFRQWHNSIILPLHTTTVSIKQSRWDWGVDLHYCAKVLTWSLFRSLAFSEVL